MEAMTGHRAAPGTRETSARRPDVRRAVPWATLGAVSLGGVIGSLARYGLTAAFPHPPRGFPWATFGVNVTGCLLIGVLMVLVTEVRRAHPLVRPFVGTGVLGGFTTFSAAVVDVQRAITADAAGVALAYLAGTLAAALLAVSAGIHLTRLATGGRVPREGGDEAADPIRALPPDPPQPPDPREPPDRGGEGPACGGPVGAVPGRPREPGR